MAHLPIEIWIHILETAPVLSIFKLRRVCRHWNQQLSSPDLLNTILRWHGFTTGTLEQRLQLFANGTLSKPVKEFTINLQYSFWEHLYADHGFKLCGDRVLYVRCLNEERQMVLLNLSTREERIRRICGLESPGVSSIFLTEHTAGVALYNSIILFDTCLAPSANCICVDAHERKIASLLVNVINHINHIESIWTYDIDTKQEWTFPVNIPVPDEYMNRYFALVFDGEYTIFHYEQSSLAINRFSSTGAKLFTKIFTPDRPRRLDTNEGICLTARKVGSLFRLSIKMEAIHDLLVDLERNMVRYRRLDDAKWSSASFEIHCSNATLKQDRRMYDVPTYGLEANQRWLVRMVSRQHWMYFEVFDFLGKPTLRKDIDGFYDWRWEERNNRSEDNPTSTGHTWTYQVAGQDT